MIISLVLAGHAVAQEEPKSEFDSKFRFGLRINPQPCWYVSGDKNNIPSGSVFGFGFGLNMEYRFSEIAGLVTGLGGDFEGGKYTFKYDPGNYEVKYWQDEAGEFILAKDKNTKSTGYLLKERKVNTTYVSIPAILKLSTKEYSGMKYFGMFGVELGYRIKAVAKDTYLAKYTIPKADSIVTTIGEFTGEDINIIEEASLVPRLGMNVGMGTEYRIGGSTSLLFSVNFFRAFNSVLKSKSEFMIYNGSGAVVKQNLKQSAIRINIGIMF
jgi:hypothetical protein